MKRLVKAMLCSVALIAAAGAAKAETFAEVLEMALTNSPEVLAQRQALRVLDEAVASARAGMRPTISGSVSGAASVTDAPAGATTTGGGGAEGGRTTTDTYTGSVGVAITQTLFDGYQTDNAIAAADTQVEAGRFDLFATEQTVLLAAAEAYVAVIQAEENLRLAINNVEVIARQLEATRARLEVGEVTRTDVAQAEARLAESKANLRAREGDLRTAREDFEQVVGVPPADLEPLPPLPPLPSTLAEAEEVALQRSPVYLTAVTAEKAAAFQVDQARGALLPQVDLSTSLSASQAPIFGTVEPTFSGSATVTMTVPIYSGGAARSAVRSSVATEEQRAHERELARRQVLRDVGVNWESLITARARIVANLEQVEAQRIAFLGVQEEARVGSRTTLDVLDAEQDLLDARVSLVNSRSEEQVAAYRILATMGLLSVETLGLDVERYDPVGPYEDSQTFGVDYPRDDDDDEWMKRY